MGKGRSSNSWAANTLLLSPSAARVERELSADLRATIDEELLPRLVLAHSEARAPAEARLPPTEQEIELLVRFAVQRDVLGALGLLVKMAGQGVSVESLLLLALAPAARLLGEEWQAERLTLTEVLDGLAVIQHLTGTLRASFSSPPSGP